MLAVADIWKGTRDGLRSRFDERKLSRRKMGTIHVGVPESVLVGSGQTREAFVEEAKFLLGLKLVRTRVRSCEKSGARSHRSASGATHRRPGLWPSRETQRG